MNTRLKPCPPREGNPGTLRAEAVCPTCRRWTPLDQSVCLMCGRPLPWRVTERALVHAERRRQGLVAWVNGRHRVGDEPFTGPEFDGYHLDYRYPEQLEAFMDLQRRLRECEAEEAVCND